jgi:hypothetical protein
VAVQKTEEARSPAAGRALIALPDTPGAVKTELKGLQTNPAFKQDRQ